MVEFRSHLIVDKVHKSGNDHFRHGLLPGDPCNLQSGAQPDAQNGNNEHDQPADHQSLGQVNGAQKRNVFKGGKNPCAID